MGAGRLRDDGVSCPHDTCLEGGVEEGVDKSHPVGSASFCNDEQDKCASIGPHAVVDHSFFTLKPQSDAPTAPRRLINAANNPQKTVETHEVGFSWAPCRLDAVILFA